MKEAKEANQIDVDTVVHAEATRASEFARKRLNEQYLLSQAVTRTLSPYFISDGDRYRWMRANRDNFAIRDALSLAGRDADFDAAIDAAIRTSVAGRSYFSDKHDALG